MKVFDNMKQTTLNHLKELNSFFQKEREGLSIEAVEILSNLSRFVRGEVWTLSFEAFLLFFNEETQTKFLALDPDSISKIEQGLRTVFRQKRGDVMEFYLIDFNRYYNNDSTIYKFFTYNTETQTITICRNLGFNFDEGTTFYFSPLIFEAIFKDQVLKYCDIYESVAAPIGKFYLI